MTSGIITLLTDFGNRDGFVGIMKGVILNIFPEARIIDISHEIEPQNLSEAAFVLKNSFKFFREGTVHVVVVDPGVGSGRRIICVSAAGHLFLAPDNGVLKLIFADYPTAKVWEVTNKNYFLSEISQTFHGRDIFAPVAAHLAKGLEIEKLGNTCDGYTEGPPIKFEEHSDKIVGEIIYHDHFGNLISNIPGAGLKKKQAVRVYIKNHEIQGLVSSYADGKNDAPIALIGSSGYLEIALNLGNARHFLDSKIGNEIIVNFENKL